MMLLALILGVALIIWGAVLLRWGGLIAGCLAVILTGTCLGYSFFHVAVITIDRALLGALVVLYLLLGRFGLAKPKPLGRLDLALVAFLAFLAVSVFTHDWQIKDAQPLATYLFFYIMPATIYWLARESPLDERASRIILAFFALFGVYLGITALAERFEQIWMVLPRYISSPDYAEFLGRARGPFLNPVALGIYLTTCTISTAMFWPRCGRFGRLALLCLIGLLSVGTYCTMTRSVWLGLAAGLCLVIATNLPKVWRMPFLTAICMAGIVLVAAKWSSLNSFQRDKQVTAEEMEESAKLRPILAAVAWRIFEEHPWFGVGSGQYLRVCGNYVTDRNTKLVLEKGRRYVQHNVFLAQLAENGLIGLGLFLALVMSWCWCAWKNWSSSSAPLWARQQGMLFLATLAAFGINGMFHDVGIINMVNLLVYFLAGINTNIAHLLREPPSTRPPASARSQDFACTVTS